MRNSIAWILCALSATGCGLENPGVLALPDAALVGGSDAPADLGAPLDAQPDDRGDPIVDAATDVHTDDGTAMDAGDAVADLGAVEDTLTADAAVPDKDAADGSEDAGPGDAPADITDAGVDVLDVSVDGPAKDAPSDAPTDRPVDVVVDVPSVDVGPPISWRVIDGDARSLPWRHGSPGDSFDNLSCGPGQLLVGLTTWSSLYVSGLAPWCAPLNANGTLGAAVRGTRRGGTFISSDDDRCPANQAIVRFTINSGAVIDRLQATCAPLAGWLARREFGAVLSSRGDSGGGSRAQDDCPEGYIGNGLDLRSGDHNLIERVLNLRLRCVRVSDR